MMSNEVSGVACVTETIDIAHVPGVHPSEWSRGFGITNLSNSLEFYIGAGSMQLASMMRQERKGVVMNPALEAMMPTARFETNVLASPPPDPCFASARRPLVLSSSSLSGPQAGVWNTLKLGDGGNIENTASLALLRRKCKEVLVVVGTSTGPFVSKFSKKEQRSPHSHRRPHPATRSIAYPFSPSGRHRLEGECAAAAERDDARGVRRGCVRRLDGPGELVRCPGHRRGRLLELPRHGVQLPDKQGLRNRALLRHARPVRGSAEAWRPAPRAARGRGGARPLHTGHTPQPQTPPPLRPKSLFSPHAHPPTHPGCRVW